MKLSIIIPVFNEKKTIMKLLDLVENQKFIEKQIIVVDDCSNDNSYEIKQCICLFNSTAIQLTMPIN